MNCSNQLIYLLIYLPATGRFQNFTAPVKVSPSLYKDISRPTTISETNDNNNILVRIKRNKLLVLTIRLELTTTSDKTRLKARQKIRRPNNNIYFDNERCWPEGNIITFLRVLRRQATLDRSSKNKNNSSLNTRLRSNECRGNSRPDKYIGRLNCLTQARLGIRPAVLSRSYRDKYALILTNKEPLRSFKKYITTLLPGLYAISLPPKVVILKIT